MIHSLLLFIVIVNCDKSQSYIFAYDYSTPTAKPCTTVLYKEQLAHAGQFYDNGSIITRTVGMKPWYYLHFNAAFLELGNCNNYMITEYPT